jgi:hypothetical protein
MLDLINLFNELTRPSNVPESISRFSARSVPGYERHRIAKDHSGGPVLLIASPHQAKPTAAIPVQLEHLTVIQNTECTITHEDNSQETGNFSIIRCTSNDSALQHYFLQMLDGVIAVLGPAPSANEVSRAIHNLVELFRAMAEPARKTVQGFWAELFLIARSTDPVIVMGAWHPSPIDIYDFSADHQRIEVKSANGRVRQHHFSLAQLQPPAGSHVLIASILMERAGAGVSLGDLIEEIRSRLAGKPELLIRLDQVVVATLGESWRRAFEQRFDYELAEASLRFYSATDIPAVGDDIPPTVSDVHFKANITGSTEVKRQQMRNAGGLYRAVLPR